MGKCSHTAKRARLRGAFRGILHAVQERVMFFDPGYGIGLTIAAGSGRSWMDQPDGDPVTAHLHVDVAGESIVVAGIVEDRRWRSHTGFVPWEELLEFAD